MVPSCEQCARCPSHSRWGASARQQSRGRDGLTRRISVSAKKDRPVGGVEAEPIAGASPKKSGSRRSVSIAPPFRRDAGPTAVPRPVNGHPKEGQHGAGAQTRRDPGPSAPGEGHHMAREGSKPEDQDATRLDLREPVAASAARRRRLKIVPTERSTTTSWHRSHAVIASMLRLEVTMRIIEANAIGYSIDLAALPSGLVRPAIQDAKCHLVADSGRGRVESKQGRCRQRDEPKDR